MNRIETFLEYVAAFDLPLILTSSAVLYVEKNMWPLKIGQSSSLIFL